MLSFYSFLFFCMLLFPSTQAAVFASSSSVDSVTAALARANLFPEVLSSSSLALEGLLSISFGPGTEAASIGRTLDVQMVGREPSMAFTPAQSSTVSLRSSFSIKMVDVDTDSQVHLLSSNLRLSTPFANGSYSLSASTLPEQPYIPPDPSTSTPKPHRYLLTLHPQFSPSTTTTNLAPAIAATFFIVQLDANGNSLVDQNAVTKPWMRVIGSDGEEGVAGEEGAVLKAGDGSQTSGTARNRTGWSVLALAMLIWWIPV